MNELQTAKMLLRAQIRRRRAARAEQATRADHRADHRADDRDDDRDNGGMAPGRQDEASIASIALGLPAVRRAGCVALYASLPGEPGTGQLRRQLGELGVRVLLPVIADGPGTDRVLDWSPDTGALVTSGVLHLPEPTGERLGPDAIREADVLLIPAMAVDTRGTRIGRGRGYYDDALARLESGGTGHRALVLALVHDDEVLDADDPATGPVPAEPHDRRVHGVITPTRLLIFPGAPTGPEDGPTVRT